eukprot:GHVT01011777.1.p1 GENE.GHVT01011777.1~~GHVT01011777.1.p1  ORF type:complete len:109 (+),score=7.66 GHVT01011777.1:1372-1698(+)
MQYWLKILVCNPIYNRLCLFRLSPSDVNWSGRVDGEAVGAGCRWMQPPPLSPSSSSLPGLCRSAGRLSTVYDVELGPMFLLMRKPVFAAENERNNALLNKKTKLEKTK